MDSEALPDSPSAPGGSIERMKLENFMCHSNMEVVFDSRVNFITGQNGSGKSAILTALVIAFGSRARGTQRASSMKELIKSGCNTAHIKVELCNKGDLLFHPFKHDLYGDRITVERRIDASNSTKLALRAANGNIVSQKREDLEELISHFNIDVSNPCLVMTQDKSRQFLHTNGPCEKFQFFLKATQLQQVIEKLDRVSMDIDQCFEALRGVEGRVKQYKDAIGEVDKRLEAVTAREQEENEFWALKCQWAWACAFEVEEERNRLRAEEAQLRAELVNLDAQLTAIAAQAENLVTERDQCVDQMQLEYAEEARLLKETDVYTQQVQEARSLAAAKGREVKQHRERIRAAEEQIRGLREKIDDIRHRAERVSQVNQSQRTENMDRIQAEIRGVVAQMDERRRMEEELRATISTKQKEARDLMREVEAKESEQRQWSSHLQRLQEAERSGNSVGRFGGDRVLTLLREIERHRASFSRLPIGPIGAHVRLAGRWAEEWSTLVEASVGRLLDSFLAASTKDGQLLRDLARRVGFNLSVHVVNFNLDWINPPPEALPRDDLVTVLKVLECQSTQVHNALIDQASVEGLVLVRTYDEGKVIAFDRANSRKVAAVLTCDGSRLSIRGGQEVSAPLKLKYVRARLMTDVREARERAAQDLRSLEAELSDMRRSRRMMGEEIQQLESQFGAIEAEVAGLERQKRGLLYDLTSLRNEARADEELEGELNVTDLEVDIETSKAEIRGHQEELQVLQEGYDEAQQQLQEASTLKERLLEETKEAERAKERTKQQLDDAERRYGDAKTNLDETDAQKLHCKEKLELMADDLRAAEETYQAHVLRAEAACRQEELALPADGRLPKRTVLEGRLTAKKRRLEEAGEGQNLSSEESKRLREDLGRERGERQKKYHVAEARFLVLSARVTKINVSLKRRRAIVEKSKKYLPQQLDWGFKDQLSRKDFRGAINVDYERGHLTMEVNARSGAVNDVRSLSGGERSFTTLCFALALHNLAEAPFRAMDEFDIFMDNVTRKLCLRQAVEFALESNSQWIFITPHDISDVEGGPTVKKMVLSPPREC